MTEYDPYSQCAFCGLDYCGDQGDESSQYLGPFGKLDKDGNRFKHPKAYENSVLWCGGCDEGLAFKYECYDDKNLLGLLAGYEARLKVDPVRWDAWAVDHNDKEALRLAIERSDDIAVHGDKLNVGSAILEIKRELTRRLKQND